MKDRIINNIVKKYEEKRTNNYKFNKEYEEKSQVAYNSTFYSKMDSRLFLGGISQIILTIIVSALIKNPSFIFLKSFLTPITTPLILIPFSITLGEVIRKYLVRNDNELLEKLNINKKTPDFIRCANEMYYKVKSSIEKKKIEINDKVIDNISTSTNSCESNYSKLVFDNKELQSNLDSKYKELEELIQEQVLCQEYNINQSKFQRICSTLIKSFSVSIIISSILLFGNITTGLAYNSTITNLELIIRNIIINYVGINSILTPVSYIFFKRQYRNIHRAINDVVSEKPEFEEFLGTVIRQELYERIIKQYYGKSKINIKRYFNNLIDNIINEIISLQTKIEENNIQIRISQERLLKLSKRRCSIKPKVVSE